MKRIPTANLRLQLVSQEWQHIHAHLLTKTVTEIVLDISTALVQVNSTPSLYYSPSYQTCCIHHSGQYLLSSLETGIMQPDTTSCMHHKKKETRIWLHEHPAHPQQQLPHTHVATTFSNTSNTGLSESCKIAESARQY